MTSVFRPLRDIQQARRKVVFARNHPGFSRNRDVVIPLFKTMLREHVDQFMDDGTLRLGTIWDFRKAAYGDRVGDYDEGVRVTMCAANGVMTFGGAVARDQWLFCTSADLDWSRFEEDGHDSALEIRNIRFFYEVGQALVKQQANAYGIILGGIDPISYCDDIEIKECFQQRAEADLPDDSVFPLVALLKPTRYAMQKEVRAWYEPSVDVNKHLYPAAWGENINREEFLKARSWELSLPIAWPKAPDARKYVKIHRR